MLCLVSCAGPQPGLDVKAYHLREVGPEAGSFSENEVVRAERLKKMYGAVSAEERRARLGNYYTVRWDGPAGTEGQAVRVVFDYRQARTASKILTMTEENPGAARGRVEFAVSGEAYQTGGRVLSWRVRLYRAGTLVDTKKSYLWD